MDLVTRRRSVKDSTTQADRMGHTGREIRGRLRPGEKPVKIAAACLSLNTGTPFARS